MKGRAMPIVMSVAFLMAAGVAAAQQGAQAEASVAQLLASANASEEVPPERCVRDPYAEFNGIAVDPVNNLIVMSAPNIRGVMLYPRTAGTTGNEVTAPLGMISGPRTHLSGMSGVMVDPLHQEFYGIETDIGDSVAAFPYRARGNTDARVLAIPIGGWGMAMSPQRREFAVSIEDNDQLMIFGRGAQGVARPLRQVRGKLTTLADPKGVAWDVPHHELIVANEGNWSRSAWDPDYSGGGEYRPPSITVFAESANGDAKPLRVIQGKLTGLDAPAGLAVDPVHDEIAVVNSGDGSVLIFGRTASGNIAPKRIIKGPHTLLKHPIGLALDPVHNELWVANWGHTAEVFERTASGDAAPKRVIRSAPPGTPVAGMSVIPALGYDSKRDQLLVPN
ncbi:MAG: hypothetical protein IVW54_19625 [Candidatus Binataceae bacterium]|nr:hypothetical protein [Candidatus Binataceae bacterium]